MEGLFDYAVAGEHIFDDDEELTAGGDVQPRDYHFMDRRLLRAVKTMTCDR